MRNCFTWTLLLILPCSVVWSRPLQVPPDEVVADPTSYDADNMPKLEDASNSQHEQVISVRITSSVAIGRGRGKLSRVRDNRLEPLTTDPPSLSTYYTERISTIVTDKYSPDPELPTSLSPELLGANIEFIKQLHSKKESRGLQSYERIHTFPSDPHQHSNETEDSIAEPSIKSTFEINDEDKQDDNDENVPLARSVSHISSQKNYIQRLGHKSPIERIHNPKLTTVSFNIVHDTPKVTSDSNEPVEAFMTRERSTIETPKVYNEPVKYFNEPAKVYSQPAQVYSEPAKFYSEPAKIYSEPAKVYSEPAKVYSEPAKIYSEPAKFYSQPASLHLPPVPPNYTPWQPPEQSPTFTVSTTPVTTLATPSSTLRIEHQPEKNYEVDEKISVLTDGRSHGVQETTTESCKQENCKVGYVVEGRQYRKYRVEERTPDGFIVGEYGVVRHEDGALRGVRYTADSDASPRLIYDALMKFLQLK